MSVTRNEIVDLLSYIAAADHRGVPDRLDVQVWLDAATDGQWPSLDFAYRAVVRHRNNNPGVWLEPGHITQQWRAVRAKAMASFTIPMPPKEIDIEADPHGYVYWCRAEQAKYVDQYVRTWLTNGDTDDDRVAIEQ